MSRSENDRYLAGCLPNRSDGRWVAQFIHEDGTKKQLYRKSQKEAIAALQKALHEQEQGTLATGPQQTLKQFLEYWLEDVHKATIRTSTYTVYREILDKHLLPGLGRIRLQKLTAQHVQSLYAKKLREGLSASRVRTIHAVLHKALVHAKRIKLVGSNVCDDVELPRSEPHQVQPLTPEQAQLLLQKVREHHLEAVLTLALATGMRKGEMLGLRWQDIDLEKGVLQVRRTVRYLGRRGFIEGEPKTAKGRRKIVLPRFVLDALRRHRAVQLKKRLAMGAAWVERDLVFPDKCGDFMVPATLSNQYGGASEGRPGAAWTQHYQRDDGHLLAHAALDAARGDEEDG
jgi:integrase